ncbi:MAG TPA: hypothetical protein VFB65_05715 [Pyrinomonadaceae bacterium]|nr:hypothetical protein [Pyrinomonadaceae bacterium]
MISQHFRKYSFLPLFFFIFLLSSRPAEACSCGERSTVLEAFTYADVVVVVNAVSVEKAGLDRTAPPGRVSSGRNYIAGVKSTSMRVEQVFKGTLKAGDEMIFAQGGGGDCIWTFSEQDVGKKFLFYLKRISDSTHWVAGTCGRSQHLEHAGDDLLYLNNLDKVRNKTRISGTLRFFYNTDESLAGLKVRIVGAKDTQEIKTDSNGVYEIYDLPAGRYYVEPEVPKGWKVAQYGLASSPSLDRNAKDGTLQRIPIILAANQHAALDINFEIDNAVRGHIYDPMGQPMNGVCLNLVPADGTKGRYLADCTEEDGAFQIGQIPPGDYVVVVNDDGKMTSSEPFGKFYYPNTLKREEATVFNIGLGDVVENLDIYPQLQLKTVTVKGTLVHSDGKPIAEEWVYFKSIRKQSDGNDENERDADDARAQTDAKGRFSMRVVHGANGILYARMYGYAGKYENCPQFDRLVKEAGSGVPEIKTAPVEIRATTNVYAVELKFPFPACKKAKRE